MHEAAKDPATKPPRRKNAHYDVFRQGTVVAAPDGWALVTENVSATSRREAITKAAGELREDDRYGTFATVRHGEFKVLTRAKKTIVADDWGPA